MHMKIGLIGDGAIAGYVRDAVARRGHEVAAILVRPARVTEVRPSGLYVGAVAALPGDLDLVIDCAGHAALAAHGPAILARGTSLITVSLGALADAGVHARLESAAISGGARLHLASGAIGALDCLRAARMGRLDSVTYTGRKPPGGWRGSPAEERIDLDALGTGAATHFDGSAREAAMSYPKNANVAAAVALAGTGFDATRVQLIADGSITANIHEITANGDFGSFYFRISGNAMAGNPRSSALAAMSVLSKLEDITALVSL